MNILRITVDPEVLATGAFGTGAVVRVESSATGGGAGFAELGTVAIVAAQMEVTYYHATGTSTTWYRTRYSKASPVAPGDWSEYGPEFQSEGTVAYATVSDFTSTFESEPASGRLERIAECLEEASSLLEGAIGWDFYRHPTTSTEIRYFDGPRDDYRLCVHEGIVSVSELAVRSSAATSTWTVVAAGDYFLDPRVLLPGESYTHLTLTRAGAQSFYWPGIATIRVTGVFGYSVVPTRVKRATVALAREIYRADSTFAGSTFGSADLGGGAAPAFGMWPRTAYDCVKFYKSRDFCYAG